MKCKTKNCSHSAVFGRRVCHRCKQRTYRANNKVKAAFDALKHNSKRRGKEFLLTLDQFATFCQETKYIAGKGRSSTCLSIDRIDNTKGYTIENIRALPFGENVKKGTKVLMYDYQTGYATVI